MVVAAAPALAGQAPHAMTLDEMSHLSRVYWATHTPHGGTTTTSGQAVAATFTVVNYAFNSSQGANTAQVLVGDAVDWNYGSGFHTTTSGTDPFDPSAGVLWDAPIDPINTSFEYVFTATGSYPFFCSIHGTLMTGSVEVMAATAVEPAAGEAGRIGFVTSPAPNPTHGRIAFRFGLAKAGRVTLRVVDPQGRLVAQPIDGGYGAGTYAAVWDGRTRGGELAKAGVYYLVLSVPNARQTRTVALQR
jgi:plastocyanin